MICPILMLTFLCLRMLFLSLQFLTSELNWLLWNIRTSTEWRNILFTQISKWGSTGQIQWVKMRVFFFSVYVVWLFPLINYLPFCLLICKVRWSWAKLIIKTLQLTFDDVEWGVLSFSLLPNLLYNQPSERTVPPYRGCFICRFIWLYGGALQGLLLIKLPYKWTQAVQPMLFKGQLYVNSYETSHLLPLPFNIPRTSLSHEASN